MESKLDLSGDLKVSHKPHGLWSFRIPFGRFWITKDKGEAVISEPFISHLQMDVHRNGKLIESIDCGSGLVTTAGVTLLAADWTNGTATLKLANWHDSGTGATPAAIADTALQTATGIARVSGTQSNVTNVYKTIGTITYNNSYAVTEWGLFTNSAGATLWDHRVFAAVNVVNQDQITFTYSLTCTAGG